jgi:adenosylmethionine-8-amino-7-oxononanoate aminotransferase
VVAQQVARRDIGRPQGYVRPYTEKIKTMKDLLQKDKKYIWHPYTQAQTAAPPLPIVRGKATQLFDNEGNAYIDAVSSWWVNTHGHAHPYIAKKVYEQLLQLEHVIFAGFTHAPAVELAERIVGKLPDGFSRVFYSDNGSTSVEIGVKMAIQYFYNQGIEKKRLLAFENGFHGETFGTMSSGGVHEFNAAFTRQLFDVQHIKVPTEGEEHAAIEQLKMEVEKGDVYAFLFEPLIQGAGGMVTYSVAALDEMIGICQANGVIAIADEVMTGFYRTGKMFASEYLTNTPDIICLSKGLTGGTLPLALTVCREEIFEAFLSDDKLKTFFHGHSYTGNPVGCAAALACLDLYEKPDFEAKIQHICEKHTAFKNRIENHSGVRVVRQCGTILAIEFETGQATSYFNNLRDTLYYFFLEKGLLLRPLGNVIYIMAPYCIEDEELERVYDGIEEALDKFCS